MHLTDESNTKRKIERMLVKEARIAQKFKYLDELKILKESLEPAAINHTVLLSLDEFYAWLRYGLASAFLDKESIPFDKLKHSIYPIEEKQRKYILAPKKRVNRSKCKYIR